MTATISLDQAIRELLDNADSMHALGDPVEHTTFSLMVEVVEAVLDLHKPGMAVYGAPTCVHCYETMDAEHETATYPCPTVHAIAEKLGVEVDGG